MRLQELGFEIRKARIENNLTQARLATLAKVSRTTLNQLENGLFPDIGVKRLLSILDQLGLGLIIQPIPRYQQDFIQMASKTASVSFKNILSEDELIKALLSGRIPAGKKPHFRTLIDEAPPSVLEGLIKEVARWTKPGRVEKNLARIARESKTTRRIEEWLHTT